MAFSWPRTGAVQISNHNSSRDEESGDTHFDRELSIMVVKVDQKYDKFSTETIEDVGGLTLFVYLCFLEEESVLKLSSY